MKYKVWWMTKHNNFGDILTPKILDHFKIDYEYSELKTANLICVGSIARHALNQMIVLGAGIIHGRKEKLNPNADWRFVRGPFTRKKILDVGGRCPEIYGDPAMLLPLFCDESKKQYDIGFVPHIIDYQYVKEKYPGMHIINLINEDPLITAKEITKCRYIISSSLHGIIAAHAYGIPAAWVKFSNRLKGDDVKFADHYASLGIEAELSTAEQPLFKSGNINLNKIKNIFEHL